MEADDGQFKGRATGEAAVDALGVVLREREKTKRLLIGAACFFLIVAALIAIFAPPDKQTMGYILGAALLVIALGAIGAAQFKIKVPGIEIQANESGGRNPPQTGSQRGSAKDHPMR